jgi:hypothetical protein
MALGASTNFDDPIYVLKWRTRSASGHSSLRMIFSDAASIEILKSVQQLKKFKRE